MISYEEKQEILSAFPNIKLCYDSVQHNKVDYNYIQEKSYDICLAIPCGKKCFAWFTHIQNESVCLIMELGNNKNIHDIKIVNCAFNDVLTYGNSGTILYGTMFQYSHAIIRENGYKSNSFFAIEDIFYWKGNSVNDNTWLNKLKIITGIFKTDIKQVVYNNNYLLFGLPLIASSLEDLKLLMNDIKYKIYNVQFCKLDTKNRPVSILFNKLHTIRITNSIANNNSNNNSNNKVENVFVRHHEPSQPLLAATPAPPLLQVPSRVQNINTNTTANENKTIVFKIKPDIQNDIYNLYCIENNVETFYNIAYIPDYKTSVMMNKLFRNIKENDNLDLLEESDDEDEFQNESADRFVDMNKSLLMICKYNYKFKKWYPVKVFENMARETNNVIVDRNVLVGCEQYNKNTKNTHVTKNYKNNYQNNYQNKKYNKYQNKI